MLFTRTWFRCPKPPQIQYDGEDFIEECASAFEIFSVESIALLAKELATFDLFGGDSSENELADFKGSDTDSWKLQSDEFFVHQRMWGVNPCALRLISKEVRALFPRENICGQEGISILHV